MSYLMSATGNTTGIQYQGNISYGLGNNLRSANATFLVNTNSIANVSGTWDERFDDTDYTGGIPTKDIQNATGTYTGSQYLGGVVYGMGIKENIDQDFIYTASGVASITGLYQNRFDDITYYS